MVKRNTWIAIWYLSVLLLAPYTCNALSDGIEAQNSPVSQGQVAPRGTFVNPSGATVAAPDLTPLGTIIARVPVAFGGGNHNLEVIRDGDMPPPGSNDSMRQYDTYEGPGEDYNWIGYRFNSPKSFAHVTFQEGGHFGNGGWFQSVTVQVRQSDVWVNVPGVTSSPSYPTANSGNDGISYTTYELDFPAVTGDAIRIYGPSGGSSQFISVGELRVFGAADSLGSTPGNATALSIGGNPQTIVAGGGIGTVAAVITDNLGQAVQDVQPTAVTLTLSGPSGPENLTPSGTIIARVLSTRNASAHNIEQIRSGDQPSTDTADPSRDFDTNDSSYPAEEWVGYQFSSPHTFTHLVFEDGVVFPDGGWFDTLGVQVLQAGVWVDVPGVQFNPAYPYSQTGANYTTYDITFPAITGDAIRLWGAPGGNQRFISISNLQVYGPNVESFSQTLTGTTINGVASFNFGVFALSTAGTYTLTPAGGGLSTNPAVLTVDPNIPAHLGLFNVPGALTAGANLGTVLGSIQDVYGNTVTGSTDALTATITGPDSYTRSLSESAVNGTASFDLTAYPLTAAGNYTLTLSGNNLTLASAITTVNPAVAVKLVFDSIPTPLSSGSTTGTIKVSAQDANGYVATTLQAPINIVITGPSGYHKTISTGLVSGIATLDVSGLDLQTAGTYAVAASAPGLTQASGVMTLNPGAPAALVISASPSTLSAGSNLGTVIASIKDAFGNTVPSGAPVLSATISGPGNFSQVVTASANNGLASLNLSSLTLGTAGSYTVTVSSAGLSSASNAFAITPGQPSHLVAAGLPTTLNAGTKPGVISVTIEDAFGNTETSLAAPLVATISGPGGYSQLVTGSLVSGVASLDLRSLSFNAAGNYTVILSGAGLTAAPAILTVNPGTASQLTIAGLPDTVVAGGNPGVVTASARDAYGNIAASTASVVVTVHGPNDYSQMVTGSFVNGTASFDLRMLKLNAAGSYTVVVTGAGLIATSPALTVNPGTASQLTIASLPETVVAGGNPGVLTVTAKDAYGNPAASTASVAVTIHGPGSYSQLVTGSFVSGVAGLDLRSLKLNEAGSYTLVVTAAGLTAAPTTLTVNPGTASQLTIAGLPETVAAGGNPGVLTVTAKDAYGNIAVSTASVVVTVHGPNGYSQMVTGSLVSGIASLDLRSLSLNAAGNYSLTTVSDGTTSVSTNIAVVAGAASRLIVSSIPDTLLRGAHLGTVSGTLEDVAGNLASESSTVLTAMLNGPNGVTQALSSNASGGHVSLNLSTFLVANAGSYTLSISGPGLTTVTQPILVAKTASSLAWMVPPSIDAGTALDTRQLDASASVPGSLSYTPPAGIVLAPGSHTLSVSFTPQDSQNYTEATGSVQIRVRALTTTSVAVNKATELAGRSLTFTAQISSAYAGSPSGSVTFQDGATVLSTVPMNQGGLAAYTTSSLPVGEHLVTAMYSGDANYAASTSASLAGSITVADLKLDLKTEQTRRIVPGAIAVYGFPVVPVDSAKLLYDVKLTATGLPQGATYSFSPADIPAGSAATPVVLTIKTAGAVGNLAEWDSRTAQRASFVSMVLMLPLLGFRSLRKRSWLTSRILTIVSIVLLGFGVSGGLSGCGGGSFGGSGEHLNTSGTYTITIKATSGSLVRTSSVLLILQEKDADGQPISRHR